MRLGPTVDGSAEGPDASLRSCVRSLLDFFLTFRSCSSAVDSFLGLTLLLLSSTCPVSSNVFRTHTLLRYAKFLANSSLWITLLEKKYYFLSVKLCYLWRFSLMQQKKWEQMMCRDKIQGLDWKWVKNVAKVQRKTLKLSASLENYCWRRHYLSSCCDLKKPPNIQLLPLLPLRNNNTEVQNFSMRHSEKDQTPTPVICVLTFVLLWQLSHSPHSTFKRGLTNCRFPRIVKEWRCLNLAKLWLLTKLYYLWDHFTACTWST